jgi:hypothetical protein
MTWSNPGAILLAMHTDPANEWLRLAEEYRAKGDDELLELAADFTDLTEPAQQALRNEMHSRKLGDPAVPRTHARSPFAGASAPNAPNAGDSAVPAFRDPEAEEATSRAGIFDRATEIVPDGPAIEEDEDPSGPHDYTWKTVLCACDEYKEAWRISEALRRAGIASWIERQGSKNAIPWVGEFMTGELQVQVAADELDSARAVASQPIPHDIIEDSETETPEFVLPKCPKCGAEDPVLESADPQNTWRCEQCDATWSDPMEASDESPAKRAEPAS